MIGTHLLVVDDDVGSLDVLSEYLLAKGYHVTAVDSGTAAVQVIRTARPDLILLATWMPGMDGLTTLDRIVAADATLPVVMMTAADDHAVTAFALRHGACDFVSKPVNFRHLDQVLDIQLVLSGRAPEGLDDPPADDMTLGLDLGAYALSPGEVTGIAG